jgi:hypothetical protein
MKVDQAVKWRELVQLAPDVKTVQAIMRDYVGTITPIIGMLPQDCAEVLRGELDIQAAAVCLLQAELRVQGSSEARALLHEVAYTFASASVRITLLHVNPAALVS